MSGNHLPTNSDVLVTLYDMAKIKIGCFNDGSELSWNGEVGIEKVQNLLFAAKILFILFKMDKLADMV